MAKRKYPRSAEIQSSNLKGPAYVKLDSNDNNFANASTNYAKALEEVSTASFRRDYSNLTTNIDGRPGLRGLDFDWFRPEQAAPTKPKDIIAFARYAYRRIGLIHNAIDLMGDFATQGIRLAHPNPRIERFYNEWFQEVQGPQVCERLAHLLFREANVPLRYYTAKIYKAKKEEMQKAIGEADILIDKKSKEYAANEIPWRYVFIDPLLIEPLAGELNGLTKTQSNIFVLKVPPNLKIDINKLLHSSDPEAQKIIQDIPPDILDSISSGKDIILPPDKTYMFYYKKDDWKQWADPMIYAAYEPLSLYQKLQLADKAALDGAISKIRVWKLGSLEFKLAPTEVASSTLAQMLGANVGGGTIDIIWGPDIELIETDTDVSKFLGKDKYVAPLEAIYSTIGLPPTLTGTFGASGTTNNFISLKTLTERLNYVRSIIIKFWNEQIKIIQKAMGFRYPAQVEFDFIYLDDPASIVNMLTNLADRNFISEEFVQRHIKANPDLEYHRKRMERKYRENDGVEKISPYHQVDKEHNLKKIALQTGVSSPSEVGLELQPKKSGEKSLMDVKTDQLKIKPPGAPPGLKGSPKPGLKGRPKTSKDKTKRKTKVFKPKTKASIDIWARRVQEEISNIINPVVLKSLNKTSLRSLTLEEINTLEMAKFEILCNLDMDDTINADTIAQATLNVDSNIHQEFNKWLQDAKTNSKKLTIEEVRDLRRLYYIDYKYGDINESESL